MSPDLERTRVVVVGGGFAGIGCARRLAKHSELDVTLIDQHNYHQFQPLLYQVASSQLAPSDIAYSLRKLFRDHPNVHVMLDRATSFDVESRTVHTAEGAEHQADAVVLAAGSQPNFFRTRGAHEHAFPLYALDDATRLRSRVIGVFEDANRTPSLIDEGALNFVVVGGGPTGVETAGALADLIHETMAVEYHALTTSAAQVHLVDHGPQLLAPFSDRAHDYVAKVLTRKGVRLHLSTAVTEVGAGHVALSDGTTIRTRCVVWGGGIMAPALAAEAGLPRGRGGRIEVGPDLMVEDHPGVYVVGDMANVPGADGEALPQLGSVALQTGRHAADNIVAVAGGKHPKPFHYRDKGIMAMIGRGAAIAEVGAHRHELHGPIAFAAWLGVHAELMTGVRDRIDAFVAWASDYFSEARGPQVLDRPDAARIDWGDDAAATAHEAATA